MRRRRAVVAGLVVLWVLGCAVGALWFVSRPTQAERGPLVLGVLHAQTGRLATTERPLIAAVALAVQQINAAGGLLGRRLEMRVEDTRSDPAVAADVAARLMADPATAALIGCWTSACRDAVRPRVESARHLMFFPVAYEGMEQSPHLIYTGATPNQQTLPALDWALQTFGRRLFLVGSDGPHSRRAHVLLRDFIQLAGGQVVGDELLPIESADSADWTGAVARMAARRPDVVFSTVTGDGNRALFDALVNAGLADLPLLSLRASEPEMRAYGGGRLGRHFTAWAYLQSLPTPANADFLAQWRALHGTSVEPGDPAVSAYVAVRLWAAAVREAGRPEPDAVNALVVQQTVDGPFGMAAIDLPTRHLWRPLRIAQVRPSGELGEVALLAASVRPSPWPGFRSRAHWADVAAQGRP